MKILIFLIFLGLSLANGRSVSDCEFLKSQLANLKIQSSDFTDKSYFASQAATDFISKGTEIEALANSVSSPYRQKVLTALSNLYAGVLPGAISNAMQSFQGSIGDLESAIQVLTQDIATNCV